MDYLFWAYTAIWILIFAYTLYLGKRQADILKELELLKTALVQKAPNKGK